MAINTIRYLGCFFTCALISGAFLGCKKQDEYLNAVPSNKLAVLTSLKDVQLLLQNEGTLNNYDPSLGIISGDEFYPKDVLYAAVSSIEKNAYVWAADVYPNQQIEDWNDPYNQLFYSNTALDALPSIKIRIDEEDLLKKIKGTALFFRAKAHFNLMQIFTVPYDSLTASTDLGIPLRLSSDLNIKSVRSSQKKCYDQIIQDLVLSIELLPSTTDYITQPTNATANAFLARVYLVLGNYAKAFQYADACLSLVNTLTDYNEITPIGTQISNTYLSEDIFHSTGYRYSVIGSRNALIDSELFKSYDSTDLRKTLFFHDYGRGGVSFVGTYDIFNFNFYSGIAIDEVYLIRGESSARLGHTTAAMSDLNALLSKRYKTGTFTSRIANSSSEALDQVLIERRKELIFRGRRWEDLRRLNKDIRYAKTLTRLVNGVTYSLSPNDKRYALPIPDIEIMLSGLTQNAR